MNKILFEGLTDGEQELLDFKKKQLTYQKGENIFKQGAFAPYVIYILEGLVKVYLQTDYDKQINIRLARPGDFLAFSAVFGDDVYNYSTIALKDSRICMIDREGLKQVLLKNTSFAYRVTAANYRNEKHLFEVIGNVSYKQMRGKLASILIYLSSEEFADESVFTYLSRHDLADFASISTESTIKFLKEFEKEGLLTLAGKDIEIIQREKLELIAKRG